ncbi:terminase small subunit [Synechococcus phage S-CAM9]|uniref:Terminase small subunit n=1 Tax=Synechococcus phage S-CAM9 TaxID=1883369 RepID=A0A1D8KP60_9CAUD|nr:terminase small subunit [Synechococcus phage S-CAM9]AOV60229.1 terminase small subunit [Synechococcus phage S-CAM9]AOV60456.1 terminase small subunit [Synechococcus phage S-CAM9]AOV60685.1 terminase small subunit [Synechococcus phage S-CAM9]
MANDPIGDALEINATDGYSEITPISRDVEVVRERKEEKTDLKRDYEYTRGQLYSLIEKGQEAIDGIMEISQETGSARAYEVTGQIIKSVADATDKLLDLQKKLRDIEEPKEKGPNNVTNALFVGSTAELQKLLKKGKLDG